MNRLINIIMAAVLAGIMLISCNEFSMLEKGEGYLSVSLETDASVQTKASSPDQDMVFSLNIYDSEGESVAVVEDHRSLEAEPLTLTAGTYRITASSGSQPTAVWDAPFYYGEATVKILPDVTNTAEITCGINNVLVTVEFEEEFTDLVDEYHVDVDNGVETLTFSEEDGTLGKTAYFSVTGTLNWKLTFKNADGETYTSSGTYTGVTARQHYNLKFALKEAVDVVTGAAGFTIVLDDSRNPVKEINAILSFGSPEYPSVKTNEGFDITSVVNMRAGDENPKVFTVKANSGISNLIIRMKTGDSDSYTFWYELVEAAGSTISALESIGITASSVAYGSLEPVNIDITRYASTLSMGSYTFEVAVYDLKGRMDLAKAEFNVQSGVDAEAYSAVPAATAAEITARWFSDPQPAGLGLEYRETGAEAWTRVADGNVEFNADLKRFSATITGLTPLTTYEFRPYSDDGKELSSRTFTTLNVVETVSADAWAKFAVVAGKWNDAARPEGLGFEYREYGTTGWISVDETTMSSGNGTFTAEIRGLEPEVTYEVRAIADGAVAEKINVVEFTTETAGTVYNMSFDDWYQSGKVWYPFAQGQQHAWDSANEGAATFIGSSTTPAEGSDAVSGKAVKMESKWAVIAFAAGNLYTGDFGKINGKGAILDWGIPFESRPLALKGYYKYSPKTIDRTGDGMSSYQGKMDKMQIQIMLADWTAPFTVNTLDKQFVDFNADYIIAYGKLESDAAAGSYQEFTIPLEYRSLTKKPKYIVISACASYLGDYFTGGVGSTLWVDEFSLEYSPENLTDAERNIVNYR